MKQNETIKLKDETDVKNNLQNISQLKKQQNTPI